MISLSFEVHTKLEDSEEQRLSDELAARMALMDSTDCKVMEEEPNSESFDVVVSDYNRTDRNVS